MIAKICNDINTSKSRGPNIVPPIVYKERAEAIASALHIIFRNIKRLGKHPTKWKNGIITPKFKKGSKSKVENYRPVTLLDIAGKIHERYIYIPIYDHFKNFFHHSNFACSLLNQPLFNFYAASIIFLLITTTVKMFFDFAKAFDKTNHQILVSKLSSLGVQKSKLAVITDYSQNRRQAVRINDQIFSLAHVLSGVPQRLLLGSLLSLLSINDLPDSIFFWTTFLFADDLKLYTFTNESDRLDLS